MTGTLTAIDGATMTSTTAVRRIIFIDSTVPDLQTLLDEVGPDAIAVVLDPDQDGVQQILDYLVANELSDLLAIQIVSHGSEGSIKLGSTVLETSNLASYADALAQIGAALASNGDIMLYGCDVAGGTTGQQFIEMLASLTGADVAASTDATGAAALGGDWVLEASTGPIEAAPAFTAAAEQNFNALLVNNVLTPTAPEFQVDTDGQNGGQQSIAFPAMAPLTGGGYVVVWSSSENGDGNGGAIFGQIFDNNNQKVGSQFQVNSSGIFNDATLGGTTQFSQQFPSVTALTDGGFVVAWQTFIGSAANAGYSIDAQRFKVDADGAIFTDVAGNSVLQAARAAGTHTEFRVSTLEPAESVTASVTGRPDGGFIFAWTDSINQALDNAALNGFGYEIRERSYTAAGVAGTEFTVNSTTANQQVAPDVSSQKDASSVVSSVVVWQSLNQVNGTSSWDIFARKIDATGAPVGGEIQLNTTTTNQQGAASITALGDVNQNGFADDGYIVVWTSLDQNNDPIHILGRRLDINGNPVGTEFQIDSSTPGYSPSVVALSDGTFVVNWNSNGGVIGRRFDVNAVVTPIPTTGEVGMSTLVNSGRADTPLNGLDGQSYGFHAIYYAGHDAMAALTDGSLVAVWTQRDISGPNIFNTNIMVRDFAVGIGAPNTAPVLADATLALNNVPEGFANHSGQPFGPLGTLISDLVDLSSISGGHNNVTDPDAGAVTGIAITALDTTHGDWWYTTDGTNWTHIGAVSVGAALALAADANTRLFFSADLGFDGTISQAIAFRAWDLSAGANGAILNTSTNGGTSAFSTATDTASITVDPFNEAPTFTGAGNTFSFTEGGASIPLETNFVISDNDDPDLAGATVQIQGFVAGDILTINGSATGSFGASITFSFVNGVLTLSGDDTFANYAAALHAVQFQHVGENPTAFDTSPTRTIDWQVSDGHAPAGSMFTHFYPPSDLTEPGWARTPRDVAVGDFNLDGNLDFVAAMSESSANRFNLVVELGNGDGTFGQMQIYQIAAIGEFINSRDVGLELGLFNNDGLLDIAVTGSTTDNVFVFLGAANGKFTPQAIPPTNAPLPPGYGTGFGPQAIASGLFDSDSEIDLVTGNFSSISFLHGNGDGTFAPDAGDPDLQSVGVNVRGIAAADIDGDNNLDIVASDDIFGVSVYFGDGTGGFDTRESYAAGTSPAGLAVDDLNKDGLLDVVVTNFDTSIVGAGTVSVLLQKADGTFENPVSYTSGGLLPKAVQIVDFDKDGNLDLAIANTGSDADPNGFGFNPDNIDPGNIAVLLGAGDGTFGAPLTFDSGKGPRSLATADIDDDGKSDIVTPDFYDATVSVLFNNSQFSATLHTTIDVTATNDAPEVLNAPAILSTVPSAPLSLKGVVFADVDGGAAGQTEIATFTAPTGFFNAPDTPGDGDGVTVTGDNTGTMTLTGSIADLNAFIDGDQLKFNATGDTTVHVVINDQGHTGGAPVPGLEDEADITIDVNEPPVIGNTGPAVSYTELTAPVLIDPDLTVDDPDGTTIDHATVTITTGGLATDRLTINGVTSSGGTPIAGTNINFSYSVLTRKLTLSGADTEANYQTVLDLVKFDNTSGNPTGSGAAPSRTITWLVNDGTSDNTTSATTTIDIIPINSPPGFEVPLRSLLTNIEGTATNIGRDQESDPLQIADVDGPTPIKGGTITISSGHIAGDRITFFDQASGIESNNDAIQFDFDPATGVFTFTTIDPSADYSQFFNSLRFSFRTDDNPLNLAFGDDPSAGDTNLTRTLTWQIDDGGASDNLSTPIDQIININAINDAPVITIPQGTLDLVTANFDSSNATVLLGDGAGLFTFKNPPPPNPSQLGNFPSAVALGDLNGDTMLDMVTANEGTADISVLLGDGRGGFTPQIAFSVAGPAKGVALGDLNGDAILDIVTANSNGTVSMLLGDGNGGFGPQTPLPVGTSPNSVALGDLNNDGKLDIVTADLGSDSIDPVDDGVSVLLGDGLGGFAAAAPFLAGPAPFSVELGVQFGVTNIFVANANSINFTVLFNFGSGTGFSSFTMSAADVINDIALGDVTGDGQLDLIASIGAGATAAIEVRPGVFSALPAIPLADTPGQVKLADINGDGKLDIVTVHPDSDTFSVLVNNGGGAFTLTPQSPQPIGAGDGPTSLALGDLDNAQVTDEDTPFVFNAANNSAITFSDGDAAGGDETLTLTVGSGGLTLATTANLLVNGNGSNTVTLTGAVTAINGAIDGLSYAPAADYNGPDTLTITADDNGHTGAGGNLAATKLVPIFINAVNDAPVLSNVATVVSYLTIPVTLDSALTITDLDDTDLESATVTITDFAAGDELSVNGVTNGSGGPTNNISWTWDGAGALSFTGSGLLADYEALLEQVQYRSTVADPANGGTDPTRTVTWVVNDGDTNNIVIPSTTISLGSPTITNLAGDIVTYTEGGSPLLLDNGANANVTDPDSANFDTGNLTVDISGNETATEDILSIASGGGIALLGSNVSFNGTPIGTFAGGINGDPLIVAFNANATPTNVGELIRHISYENNNSFDPNTAPRTIGFTVNDGDGNTSAASNVTVNITAVNDAPQLNALNGDSVTFTENNPAVRLDQGIDAVLLDDLPDLNGGTLTISIFSGKIAAEDQLQLNTSGTATVNAGVVSVSGTAVGTISGGGAGGADLVINFNASAADALVQEILRNVEYFNSGGDSPTSGQRAITWTLVDGDGTAGGGTDTVIATNTVDVVAVNDAPVNAPAGPLSVAEDTDLVITGLSVADADASAATVTVTLSVVNGTITVLDSVPGGVGTGDLAGNGSNTVILTQSLAAINATLAAAGGVIYHGNLNFNGSDTLTITSNDGGATGVDPGGPSPTSEQDFDFVVINVTAVSDTVSSNAPVTLLVDEDTSKPVTGLSIADVDATLASAGQYSVTLSSTNGTLTLTTLAGLAFTTGDGTADAAMTFTGTLSDINTALGTASYTPTPGYSGPADITIFVSDDVGGVIATGSGSATSDSDTVAVAVTPVNDSVTSSAPTTATTFEDASVVISGLSIADIDATVPPGASGLYSVTLAATQGTTTLTTLAGLTFDTGDGTADATMTFHGTLSDINAALATANYNPNANYNGAATLTISVTDDVGGVIATGTGAATSDSDIVNITVTAVNDVSTANPDTRSVFEYQTATGNVVAGDAFGGQQDTDPDGDSLAVTAITGFNGAGTVGASLAGHYGHLTVQSDGSYSYVADAAEPLAFGATVQDVFTYTVSDSITPVNTTLTVTVTGSNIGNAAANQLLGSPGPDPLFGGAGNDTMSGGLGDDFYEVDDSGDVVIEQPGQGTNDRIWAFVDYTLPANVENLVLQGAAVTGIGNSGDNVIRGNDLDNFLYGAGGHDVMFGGKGNDFFEVDSSDDQVVELPGEGFNDRIWSSADYVLPVNVESLTLIGSAESGTGNAEGNVIHGNAIANRITGAGGDDLIFGAAGGDTFVFGLNFGHDVLADFQGGAGPSDTLEFSKSVFANEAAFRAASHQIGPDVVVVFNAANHIVIANTTIAQIHTDDLLFV